MTYVQAALGRPIKPYVNEVTRSSPRVLVAIESKLRLASVPLQCREATKVVYCESILGIDFPSTRSHDLVRLTNEVSNFAAYVAISSSVRIIGPQRDPSHIVLLAQAASQRDDIPNAVREAYANTLDFWVKSAKHCPAAGGPEQPTLAFRLVI
jgi:hypothetical protein